MNNSTQVFEQLRSRLFRLAYSMLGSTADAEDIVQDAFLKWSKVDHDEVLSEWAYLSTIVSRLCLDELRSARKKREEYVGPWLPEPFVDTYDRTPEYHAERSEDLSMALMVLLERLTPVQRAVFVLHDIFGFDFKEISGLIGKSESNCRKIAQRARTYIESHRTGEMPDQSGQEKFLSSFIKALERGDVDQLKDMLTEEAVLYSDGGGKVTAARKPIHGSDNISRFLTGIAQKATGRKDIRLMIVNGQIGFVVWYDGQLNSIWSFNLTGDRIHNIYIVLNPDKLSRLVH